MGRALHRGDPCLVTNCGPFDGMVVVLEDRRGGGFWSVTKPLLSLDGARLRLVHENWITPLHEDPGYDEIILVRMARSGYDVADSILNGRRAARADTLRAQRGAAGSAQGS